MFNKLILSWRNPSSRIWTPVGILEYKKETYYFTYTNGSKIDNFVPFGQMVDLTRTYTSKDLFPIFKNRLLSKSRIGYPEYLDWLDIKETESSDILELARSRGIRATDELQLFPIPECNKEGNFEVIFFSHGVSHISESYVNRLLSLKKDDHLLLMKDFQNEIDESALLLRTKDDPVELLGFCPSFFVKDFNELIEKNGNQKVKVSVQKVNNSAPMQLKLLCKLVTSWPKNFKPFNSYEFQPYS